MMGTGGTDISAGTLISAYNGMKEASKVLSWKYGSIEKQSTLNSINMMGYTKNETAIRASKDVWDEKLKVEYGDTGKDYGNYTIGDDKIRLSTALLGGGKEESAKLAAVMSHESTHYYGERREAMAHLNGLDTYSQINKLFKLKDDSTLSNEMLAGVLNAENWKENSGDVDHWRFNLDGTIEDTEDRAIYREIINENGEFDYEKLEDYKGSRIDALVKTIGIDNFEKMAGIGSSILSFVKSLNSDESYEHILGEMYMAKHGYTYSEENDMWEGGNGKIPGLGKNDSLGVIRDSKTGKYTFFTAGIDFTREDNAFSVYDDGKGGYKDRKDVAYEDRDNTDATFWMKDVFTGKDIARETFDNAFTSVDNVYHQNSIVSEYFNMRLINKNDYGVSQVGLFYNADTASGNHIGITGYDGVTAGRYLYHPTDQKATMEGCFGPMSDSGVGNFNSTNPSDNLNGYTGAYHFQQQLNLYHSLGIYNGYQFNVHLKGKLK